MPKVKKNNKAESSVYPKKVIRTFAWASFLNDLGSDMIYPIWPLFVTSFTGVNMAVLGFIDGLGDAIVSISQAVSGYISDRIRKRKIFVWIGYLFGAFSRVGYALAPVWQFLIPYRILDRAGKIRGAPRDAIIADISTHENRGKNFGFLRMMDNLGAVLGIVLCILLVNIIGYKKLFLIAAVPSLIGAFLIFIIIKERKDNTKKIFKGFSFRDLDWNFKLFLISSSVFALGAFSYSFLIISAQKIRIGTGFIPVLYLIFTAVASLFSLPFGKLADKIGRKPVLMLSLFFWSLVCASVIIPQNLITIIFTFILFGLHKAALDPVQKAFVAELAPVQFRASTLGGFQMVLGLCAFPASFLAGIFWDKISVSAPFYLSLVLTLLSIGVLVFVKENNSNFSHVK